MTCNLVLGYEPSFQVIKQKLNNKYLIEKIIPIEDEMLGYLGKYFILKGKRETNEEPAIFSFFLKIVPNSEKQKNFVKQSSVFNNEIILYENLFPQMKFEGIPKFILGLKDNFILLEEMTVRNFQMLDKLKTFNLNFCQIALTALAEFHAKSILFERRESIVKFLNEKNCNLHSPESLMSGALKTNINGVCHIIDFIISIEKCEKQWKLVKKCLKNEAEQYYKRNFVEKKVLCHTDLWSNNILFQLDDNRNPINCCLVDFQLCRYAPPALDVLIFLYFTTTKELKKKHFEELIDFYYDELKKNLEKEDVDIQGILPLLEFKKTIKQLKLMAMTAVIAYMSIDLLTTNVNKKGSVSKKEVWNCLSFNTKELVLKQFLAVDEYKFRIKNNLSEIYEEITGDECTIEKC
ncbi:uncharacterized protein LOC122507943 [Leptopilina heterotoma]|uniref:uncharacterized protein LOC122507943 n=1 Tax=Leptopilina heterotoma TaxID=63436 RepID=UPI001CA92288|nr:uncharacterized protein LOC122507943 [Leptopilina heterotoma]